jgi:Rod binding domain-containing protein
MENINSIYTGQVTSVLPVKQIETTKLDSVSEEKKKQVAKDFESLLLNNLFDQMKNTIGDWGFEKDSASGQVDGLFWLYLARDISDKGGLGFWKEIYNSLPGSEQTKQAEQSLEGTM